jgi:hypothetical protein
MVFQQLRDSKCTGVSATGVVSGDPTFPPGSTVINGASGVVSGDPTLPPGGVSGGSSSTVVISPPPPPPTPTIPPGGVNGGTSPGAIIIPGPPGSADPALLAKAAAWGTKCSDPATASTARLLA